MDKRTAFLLVLLLTVLPIASGLTADFDAAESLDTSCRVQADAMGAGSQTAYTTWWDWTSDGTYETEDDDTTTFHTYPDGTQEAEITVKVEDSSGTTDTATDTIPLWDCRDLNSAPSPDFTTTVESDTTLEVDATASSDPDGDTLAYRWDWTDDGSYETSWSTTATASHTYPDGTATATVRLAVRDSHGTEATVTETIDLESDGAIVGSRDPDEAPSMFTVDYNGDGTVDSGDATALYDAIFEGDLEYTQAYDYNCDESLTVGDADILGQWVEGEYTLEACEDNGEEDERTVTLDLHAGWNMISIPGYTDTNLLTTDAITDDCSLTETPDGNHAYHYPADDGNYLQTNTLQSTRGYWIETGSSCTARFTTDALTEADTLDRSLASGWNMVSVQTATTFNNINGDCTLADTTIYHWNGNTYQQLTTSDTLNPKKAYWINTQNSCTLGTVDDLPAPPS